MEPRDAEGPSNDGQKRHQVTTISPTDLPERGTVIRLRCDLIDETPGRPTMILPKGATGRVEAASSADLNLTLISVKIDNTDIGVMFNNAASFHRCCEMILQ